MRRSPFVLLCFATGAIAACDGSGDGIDLFPGGTVELTMNIAVVAGGVVFYARETDRDCTCTSGEWPDVGACVGSSDAVSCTCTLAPASCLDEIRIERDGRVLAEADFDADYGGGDGLPADLAAGPSTLVVVGCGGVARIPLPAGGLLQPAIDEATDDGTALDVTWSSEPAAASAIVRGGDGFVSTSCHDDTGVVTLPSVRAQSADEAYVSVRAFAAPEPHDTMIGVATVWAGGEVADELLF